MIKRLLVFMIICNGFAIVTQTASESPEEALCMAVKQGDTETTKRLLRNGANINQPMGPWRDTPLTIAVCRDNARMVEILLKAEANINQCERRNQTPLQWAAERGNNSMVQLLLAKGAEVDTNRGRRRTPLMIAAGKNYEGITCLLLKHGADVNKKNRFGYTALTEAISKGCPYGVMLLLEAGANIDQTDNEGNSPLAHACRDILGRNTVTLLLQSGADVHRANLYGETPLKQAFDEGYIETMRQLLACGAQLGDWILEYEEISDRKFLLNLYSKATQERSKEIRLYLDCLPELPNDLQGLIGEFEGAPITEQRINKTLTRYKQYLIESLNYRWPTFNLEQPLLLSMHHSFYDTMLYNIEPFLSWRCNMKTTWYIQTCLVAMLCTIFTVTTVDSANKITPYKYTDTDRENGLPHYNVPESSKLRVERPGVHAHPITAYVSTPERENFSLAILCGGSSSRDDVVSIIHFHRYFLQEFLDAGIGVVTAEQWGVEDNQINVEEFMRHYTRTQRLLDHQTVIEHLQAYPMAGWNGKIVLVGVSEGGPLVTSLAASYADITKAVVNWSGAGNWSWPDELWAFLQGLQTGNTLPWLIRLRLQLPEWLPFAISFPQTRQEFDSIMDQALGEPCFDKEFLGMTYWYHADSARWPDVEYHKLTMPYLVVAGAKDTIITSCDEFVCKAQERHVPITYLRVPDMDHYVRKRPDILKRSFEWLQEHAA